MRVTLSQHHLNCIPFGRDLFYDVSVPPAACRYGTGMIVGIVSIMVVKSGLRSIPLVGRVVSPMLSELTRFNNLQRPYPYTVRVARLVAAPSLSLLQVWLTAC